MSFLLLASYESGTPFAPWSSSSAGTTTGRNGGTAANVGTSGFLRKTFGGITSGFLTAGNALKTTGFSGSPYLFDNVTDGSISAQIIHVGDGRFFVQIGATGLTTENFGPATAVISATTWRFLEFELNYQTLIITPGVSTSSVHIVVSFAVILNNETILTGTFDHTATVNNPVKTYAFERFTIAGPGGGSSNIIDDSYISDTAAQGDGTVNSADTTYTVNSIDIRATQFVMEVVLSPPNDVRATQFVLEVVYAPGQTVATMFPEYRKVRWGT